MRFSVRRHLKLLIYIIAACFFLNLLQRRVEYEARKQSSTAKLINLQENIAQLVTEEGFAEKVQREREMMEGMMIMKANDDNEEGKDDDEDDYRYEEADDDDDADSGHDPGNLMHVVNIDPAFEDKLYENHDEVVQTPGKNRVDENFYREREQVFQQRRQHIQQVCERLGKDVAYGSIDKAPLRRFRWLNKRKLIMCFNAKVGTSSWTQYLLEAGFPGLLKKTSHWHSTAERLLKPPYSRYSKEALDLMRQYTKIILVRDPFARIVSAYLDKIAMNTFKKLCRFLIAKYRDKQSHVNQPVPTFEEFVRFLVDHTPAEDNIWAKRKHRSDRHWFHYYANCAPCDIQYDIIATMETVHNDTRYIIEKHNLGLADNIWNNHLAKKSSEDTAIQLFQSLPVNLTKQLYQRYRVDFMMFNYSIDKYLPP